MIEIIIGFILMVLFTPKEQEYDKNDNDEIIRPILMDHFNDVDSDGDMGE